MSKSFGVIDLTRSPLSEDEQDKLFNTIIIQDDSFKTPPTKKHKKYPKVQKNSPPSKLKQGKNTILCEICGGQYQKSLFNEKLTKINGNLQKKYNKKIEQI